MTSFSDGGYTTHLDTPGQPGVLRRTGKLIPFLSISIGNPFWAHGRVWIRTGYTDASELVTSQHHGSCCNFDMDPWDRDVEAVEYTT